MLRPICIGIAVCLSTSFAHSQPGQAVRADLFESNEDPFVSTLPFQLVGNMIVLRATVDDRTGYFLLDSGSSHMIIHEKHFENKVIQVSDYQSADLTGSDRDLKKTVVHFQLGNMLERNQPVFLMDLSNIEKSKNMEILGVIGYPFLKQFEVMIDYQQRKLTFFLLDRKGERKSQTSNNAFPDQTIPMEKTRHLLYLEASVGDHTLKLGIDCGAEMSVLNKESVRKIEDHFLPSHGVKVVAFHEEDLIVSAGSIEQLRIAGMNLDLSQVVVININNINGYLNTELDGLLGYGFLSRHKIALNYKKQTLAIWDPAWPLASTKKER
jgi:hypothetical protein